MRIAWIDDDIEIIDPVIQPLVQDGHKINKIRSIRDALDSVDALQTHDLILLDMIIPPGGELDGSWEHYGGISLLRRLREGCGVVTPVIVFSVVDPNRVKAQLDPLKVEAYVRKPALPSELKRAVDAVLKGKTTRAPEGDVAPEST